MFKQVLMLVVLLACTIISPLSNADEPQNLTLLKQQLVRYHDTGEYERAVNAVVQEAKQYLKTRVTQPYIAGKMPAIILDIDETSLSNYNDMKRLDFGGTIQQVRLEEDKGTDPAIRPTLSLYQFAKDHHLAIIFLTGRYEYERESTEKNLRDMGYTHWDKLIFRYGKYASTTASVYKTAMRKKLTENGYQIVLNMGDQFSDVNGGFAEKTFKLPNPYYFIP